MDRVNPILDWNEPRLRTLIRESEEQEALFRILAKASHVSLVLFALASFKTFGMTNPSYFAITGSLSIVGYPCAYEVFVVSFEEWAEKAKEENRRYAEILAHLERENLDLVENLDHHRSLSAQWHALAPVEVPEIPPSTPLHSLQEAKEAHARKKEYFNARMKNCGRKVERAYLIYIANHPEETRRLRELGTFRHWNLKYLDPNTPFVVFNQTLNTTIEEQSELELSRIIFNPG
ncbi:MAG: hypothetical protein KDK76_05060 [Chlamydiia bacterium]|nr:hypothetical protein [Chlamydiia bacterium]